MSLETEGVNCGYCHAHLFGDDDIVYCPVCGAPHHRECYNKIGHCALEELHGTDRQYDKIKALEEEMKSVSPEEEHTGENAEGQISCQMCHEKYDFALNSCPKCGAPNIAKAGGSFVNFDFLGGVPADYNIGDGITADEAKRFVAANTQRYIPKFAVLTPKNKGSWNWMAFFFPCGWFLSRKMYKSGIIMGLLTVITSILLLPFNKAIFSLGYTGKESYMDIAQNILEHTSEIGLAVILFAALGVIGSLVIRILSGVFADYTYKIYALSAIKKIRAESADLDFDYRKFGGVNIFLFIIGFMAVEYLPGIISMLM